MTQKVELRNIKISDAKSLFNILQNPTFEYFASAPESIAAEKEFIRKMIEMRKAGNHFEKVIMYNGEVVGCCRASRYLSPARRHVCSLGCYVDQMHWGIGIATQATTLLESICFNELGIKRIEIIMAIKNTASWKVAQKCGYIREGKLKSYLNFRDNFHDCYIYAKVK
ncbi:MAG: GNAT family N-acetyltransferase [Sedimentisphaerales bacterium]|nr:GNAT family N-acetyltransferase [Sedimentisphaerales bacterium]MBN2842471.1 GNAT family N-acetyltransferase [Sedimentisphaerales bacterium]